MVECVTCQRTIHHDEPEGFTVVFGCLFFYHLKHLPERKVLAGLLSVFR
jgi:hypothetical protein